MNTYKFTIKGMTCHSCEQLITMDLEEANLPKPISINHDPGEMTIELDDNQVAEVKKTIAATNKYEVVNVEKV